MIPEEDEENDGRRLASRDPDYKVPDEESEADSEAEDKDSEEGAKHPQLQGRVRSSPNNRGN